MARDLAPEHGEEFASIDDHLHRLGLAIRERHPPDAALACGFILVGNPAPIERLRQATHA